MTLHAHRARPHSFRVFLVLAVSMACAVPSFAANTTVTGWVIDSACAYTKGLNRPTSPRCAIACAKAGSPLVILADDGTIYLPIGNSMPATGQNRRLLPFAGKRVTVTGSEYTRSGSHALVIRNIANGK